MNLYTDLQNKIKRQREVDGGMVEFWGATRSYAKHIDKNVFCTLFKVLSTKRIIVFTEQNARAISPSECAILQGFPTFWGKIGAIPDDEFPFWSEVWDEYCRVFGKRRKSEKQVRKWMKAPYREYQEYEMWGNGVALPCVRFILANIARILRAEKDGSLVSN